MLLMFHTPFFDCEFVIFLSMALCTIWTIILLAADILLINNIYLSNMSQLSLYGINGP